VTLPRFELHHAESVEEASALLAQHGDDAALLCGGTELLLLMKLGFAQLRHLVDVKRIRELHGLDAADGALVVGAATTHRELERAPLVRARWPALAAMAEQVANIRVRAVGTLGGNLCFSDPHSDPATFLLAHDAEVVARAAGSAARTIPLRDFVLGPYRTALAPGELLLSVRVPELAPGTCVVHRKIAFRERPAATVTIAVRADDGGVAEARVAVGSVGLRPVRAADAERLLTGEPDVAAAAEAAAEAADPVEDANGSVEYKRQLVRVLVARAFREAFDAAAAPP
jgi:carbon-monoxide dehydrogenase medium subunit